MKRSLVSKTSLIIIAVGLSFFAFGQKQCANCGGEVTIELEKSTTNVLSLGDNEHPYGGTFELIISKSAKSKEIFTSDFLLPLIEEKRKEDEEVTVILSDNTKLRILSRKQISAADFKPLKNLYSFE